jgi:hypothetical protein
VARLKRSLGFMALLLAAVVVLGGLATPTVAGAGYSYDSSDCARAAVSEIDTTEEDLVHVGGTLEGSASPAVMARGAFVTSDAAGNATNTPIALGPAGNPGAVTSAINVHDEWHEPHARPLFPRWRKDCGQEHFQQGRF